MNVVNISGPSGREPCSVAALIAVSKRTKSVIGIKLAHIGLLTGEDDLIRTLGHGRESSVTDLVRTLGVRSQTVTRCIDTLVERGYLEREGGALVRLTAKGVAMLPKISGQRNAIAERLEERLGAEFLRKLANDLETLDVELAKAIQAA